MSHLRDMRRTEQFRLVESHFRSAYGPSFGKPSSASQPSACPDQPLVAVRVGIRNSLESDPVSRISIIDIVSGRQNVINADGRSQHSSPKWSPTGKHLAFLSDGSQPGVMMVYILESTQLNDPDVVPSTTPSVPGTVEAISWSSDGSTLLIQVAEHGADQAAALGSGSVRSEKLACAPSWLPDVSFSQEEAGWRSAWLYEVPPGKIKRATKPGLNMWELCWAGQDHVLAVVSDSQTEDAWYDARLAVINLQTGNSHTLYHGENQLGIPTATPSGEFAAFVHCLSSDRGGVAGPVVLLEISGNIATDLDLNSVDVTQLQWLNDECLLFSGLRGDRTVAGHYYRSTGKIEEHWVSEATSGPLYPEATSTKNGDTIIVSESWNQYQRLDITRNLKSQMVFSWADEGSCWLQSQVGSMQSVSWNAPDGVEIQGYLALPASRHKAPYPFILSSHGGPVWTFRNTWGMSSPVLQLLVAQGYAVLSANPRGSTGRGPAFTAKVLGDMGGMDAQDLLSGVEEMVKRGLASEHQLGVMGVSYGGFMSAWLPTISPMFQASVAIAPITNWYSYHNTSNIGRYDEIFFQQCPHGPDNLYHHRSPVMYAGKHPTPIMQVVGGRDRCVHPSQSVEYHHALATKGVESVLLKYPEEGHGIRQFPAYIDFGARVLRWFDEHLLEKAE